MKHTISIALAALIASSACTVAIAGPYSAEMFNVFDTDKNGKISLQEFRNAGMDAEGMNWSEGLSTRCTEIVLKSAEPDLLQTFKSLDHDGDQQILESEFRKHGDQLYDDYWRATYKDADKNNDGQLELTEYKAQAMAYLKELESAYADDAIPKACATDVSYWTAYYQGMADYVEPSFSYLDESKDGKLTYEEYQGTHLW